MAQDFGDDIGEMLIRGIRGAASMAARQYLYKHGDEAYERMAGWLRKKLVGQGVPSEEAKAQSEAFASRRQVLTPFGNKSDAAYFAQVCRQNGVYADALTDKDGNGYVHFAKDDLSKVEDCIPRFSEVMTAIRNREIAEQLENSAPLSFEALQSLTFVDDLPDLPTKMASAPTRDITLVPVAVRFNDEPDNIEMRLFSEQDTEGLDIDDDVFFSGYTHDKLKAMVGKDIGEDFTVLSVGQPYQVKAKELSRESPGKEAPEHAPHVHDDLANDAYDHTKGIADKVKAAREQCRDYEDFKGILAKDGIGIRDSKAGELQFYEARIGKDGNLLPFDLKLDWKVNASTLKTRWGVDATHDWFAANTPKIPQKDLQLICNAARADLEQQGIQTLDRADGKMGFRVLRDHEHAVIEAVENRFPGHAPDDLGIQFYDPDPYHGHANVRIPTDPQVADGSKDMDGRTPDIDQGIESHDGRDTNTMTFREEYEATSSGDVAPSEVREQEDARGHAGGSPRLKDVAKECRAASQQLERESGITDRDIDISDKFEPNGR